MPLCLNALEAGPFQSAVEEFRPPMPRPQIARLPILAWAWRSQPGMQALFIGFVLF